jgi:thiamine transporter
VLRGRLKGEKSRAYYQSRELALGALIVCVIRYILHTVAGATVWAGLSIPTEAALIYSIGYNATYMIPETLVTILVALYIGEIIDFCRQLPQRFAVLPREKGTFGILSATSPYIAALLSVGALITDAVLIFPHLQDGESGEFTFAYLSEVNWIAVIIVTSVCALAAIGLLIFWKLSAKEASRE